MNRIELEEREQEALNTLEDARERIRQLEEDVRFWKGEYEVGVSTVGLRDTQIETLQDENRRLRVSLRSTCETDTEIETQCAEVLGTAFVAGDTFGVPGPLACVQEVAQRLKKAQRNLADMTKLAVDYKEANTRLEDELREFHAKDSGRTREHNLLVQENRKLKEELDTLNHDLEQRGMENDLLT